MHDFIGLLLVFQLFLNLRDSSDIAERKVNLFSYDLFLL